MKYIFSGKTGFYKGKVRDVYTINDRILVMVVSDRISAFDVILPEPIHYKGQVINQLAGYMFKACADICPQWLLKIPAPNVSIGIKCNPFPIELVVRGHLCGHAWRVYSSGKRQLCGVTLPAGMKENDPFPNPIITPSTKASQGHDEDISKEEIIKTGIASEAEWETLEKYSLALFNRGQEIAASRSLILADTKYEFGKTGNSICLMDEIHTPDSSRYFYADGFNERQLRSEKQKQLSKEFVREWLIANDFMGKQGETIPAMSPDWVNEISNRYIELYEIMTGEKFYPEKLSDEETKSRINEALKELV